MFGVPQSSLIGVTLFSLFCNDFLDIALGEVGDPQIHLYVDYTTIYVAAPTYDLMASMFYLSCMHGVEKIP